LIINATELINLQQQVLKAELENQERLSQLFVKREDFCTEGIEALK
jgi:hypothetical protein